MRASKAVVVMVVSFVSFLALAGGGGCGGPRAGSALDGAKAGAAAHADAGDAAAPVTPDAAPPPERPFAGSAAEATQLIGTALDKQQSKVQACIKEYRSRKKLPHQRVEVSVGIDQEGRLMGVTVKGEADPRLSSCLQDALSTAPFPRSHAGVITVAKSYEEIVQ